MRDYISPQMFTAIMRGLFGALIAAGFVVTTGLLGADTTRNIVAHALAAALGVLATFSGYGKYDANRAAAGEIHRSDVGYTALRNLTDRFNLPFGGDAP